MPPERQQEVYQPICAWFGEHAAALTELASVADRLADYHLLHATRAQLLGRLGDHAGARAANVRALELTDNPVERDLLRSRIGPYDG